MSMACLSFMFLSNETMMCMFAEETYVTACVRRGRKRKVLLGSSMARVWFMCQTLFILAFSPSVPSPSPVTIYLSDLFFWRARRLTEPKHDSPRPAIIQEHSFLPLDRKMNGSL